ncbi:hypothetical protein SACIGC341D_0633 [Staphylococcus aureus subsp. aureus CIGC341D]|nr:hypothetical protein SACIGC341D_0633 [Staphylococcus aureus subsp. aureus CIGC341D]
MENLSSDKIEENINMIKNHSSELNDNDMFIQEKIILQLILINSATL